VSSSSTISDKLTRRWCDLLAGLFLAAIGLAGVGHLILFNKTHPELPLVRGTDNGFYWALAHSLWVDGDLDFRNEYDRIFPELGDRFTPTGRLANKYAVGMPLLSGPAILFARLTLPAGTDTMRNRVQGVYLCWNIILGLIGCWLIYCCCKMLLEQQVFALASLVVFIFASPLAWYIIFVPSMAHCASAFAYGSLLYGWARRYLSGDDCLRWLLLAGLGAGLAASIRMQDAPLMLLIPLSEFVVLLRSGEKKLQRSFNQMAIFGGVFFIGLFPQLLYQKLLWGQWWINTYAALEGERFYWLQPNIVGLLFSTRNSLLFFHPLAFLGIIGLVFLARRNHLFYACLAVIAINFYINAAWHMWWMGVSFGARGLLNIWPFLALGFSFLLQLVWQKSSPKARIVFSATLLLLLGWSLLLLLLHYNQSIPHDGEGFPISEIPTRTWEAFSKMFNKIGRLI
jgi:hypothetical protein